MVDKLKNKLILTAITAVILLAACQDQPAPTPTPTEDNLPQATDFDTTPVVFPTITPSLVPETAVPPTLTPQPPASSATPEPLTPGPTVTIGPTVTPLPTLYSSADLQATVLARSPNPYSALAVAGNLALIGHGKRLLVVDITDRRSPETVSELELPNRVKKIQIAGPTAYLTLEIPNPVDTETTITFHTVDITDPRHPALLDSYIPDFMAVDTVVVNQIAYIVGLLYRMVAIDVSDPANIFLAKTILETENFYCFPAGLNIFTVKEELGYLYVLMGSCRNGGRFFNIFDISDPLNPEHIGSIHNYYTVPTMDIVYHENYAYVLLGGFVRVFDITDPQKPAILADRIFPNTGFARTSGKLINVGDVVYYSSGAGLEIFEQTQRFQTTLYNSLYTGQYLTDITAENGTVYLLNWDNGLIILDTADPANPVEIGRWPE